MATGGVPSSFDYDDYTEEPGASGRARPRYVNTDTIGGRDASDSDDERHLPPSHTEETLVGATEESAGAAGARPDDSSSSDDEAQGSKASAGRMGKLFGRNKKEGKVKKEKKDDKKSKKEKDKDDKKEKKDEVKKEKKGKKEKKKAGDEGKEKEEPKEKQPPKMPGFSKLGGFFRRNKKDSNTSNDSEITPPKQTSTPPSHRYPAAEESDSAPHDHSAATSANAPSDVFDDADRGAAAAAAVPPHEMDPRVRFGGPPPETIPMVSGEPLGYVPPPMVPVSDTTHHIPPVPEDNTAPISIPYDAPKPKRGFSRKLRAPLDKVFVNHREPKFQQGEGVAPLNPEEPTSILRCSTFIVVLLVAGFILGIILCALSSASKVLSVVGPCLLGLCFFGLIGKIFFTLWWESDPLPQFNKWNAKLLNYWGQGQQSDEYKMGAMYPKYQAGAMIPTSYTEETELGEKTLMRMNELALDPDEVPEQGLRFTDSDMDFPPSQEDDSVPYMKTRRDSLSSDENPKRVQPSFV